MNWKLIFFVYIYVYGHVVKKLDRNKKSKSKFVFNVFMYTKATVK